MFGWEPFELRKTLESQHNFSQVTTFVNLLHLFSLSHKATQTFEAAKWARPSPQTACKAQFCCS